MKGLIWFKKDLRLSDNSALFHACKQCTDGLLAIYIIDHSLWRKCDISAIQIEFILKHIGMLQSDLAEIGIELIVETIQETAFIPEYLLQFSQKNKVDKLFFNKEFEFYEIKRDEEVVNLLQANTIQVEEFNDQLILANPLIKTKDGNYFKVFTAFKREWLTVFAKQSHFKLFPKVSFKKPITVSSISLPIQQLDQKNKWPIGEAAAKKRLKLFIKNKLCSYEKERNFPGLDGTSALSPYLAIGVLSARECFVAALEKNSFELYSGNQGALTWMSELIWREFYRYILIAVPRICKHQAYKLNTERLPWSYDKKLLEAWQNGKTGYPIVDAAMRQLNTQGWMHNRLRMIVAVFLSKILFLDWRLGEKYFAEHLIDFDFASNNGGWQWCASTGTDAVPYFRIFNPTLQSERFDFNGDFIRRFCPELKELDEYAIHDPFKRAPKLMTNIEYPQPIVEYSLSRKRTINAFKVL